MVVVVVVLLVSVVTVVPVSPVVGVVGVVHIPCSITHDAHSDANDGRSTTGSSAAGFIRKRINFPRYSNQFLTKASLSINFRYAVQGKSTSINILGIDFSEHSCDRPRIRSVVERRVREEV